MDGGCVWQKFAQLLAMFDILIGKDLASELEKLTFDCPIHDYKYSERLITDAFGEKYNTKKMKMIGSGSISQVYKVPLTEYPERYVAIKVMHPNTKQDILNACNYYENIKKSYLFPSKYKNICDIFFLGLKEQLDMEMEFENGKKFKEQFSTNSFFLIPKMIEKSKKCLVMEYHPCKLAVNCLESSISKEAIIKMILGMYFMNYECMLRGGLVHLDLHIGNYGIYIPKRYTTPEEQVKHMRVVIYDFGQVCNLASFDTQVIEKTIIYTIEKNANQIVSDGFFKKYKDDFIKSQKNLVIEKNSNSDSFFDIFFKLLTFIYTSDIHISKDEKYILLYFLKFASNSKLQHDLYRKNPEMKAYESEILYKNDTKLFIDYIENTFENIDDFRLLKSTIVKYNQKIQ
jgi:predicted unusual protein kinase regulating ubiquinone biosynthesis (AarF/ABC1/UbiB family)